MALELVAFELVLKEKGKKLLVLESKPYLDRFRALIRKLIQIQPDDVQIVRVDRVVMERS